MKCVKNSKGQVRRVSNEMAVQMVREDGWSYCWKREWKEKVRDAGKRDR